MIIHNRVTNTLKIVEKVDLRGPLDLFLRSFSASTGFILEVFRDGRHLASITPTNTGRGNLHALTLASHALQVNLGPRIMKMSGGLPTQDAFTREYEMELSIHVSDSTQFATLYIQNSDPAVLAQKAIESLLINYSQSRRHDEIHSAAIMELGRASFSAAAQQRSGIAVDEILHVNVHLDPSHQQVADTRQHTNIAAAQLDAQAPLEQKRAAYALQIEHLLAEHKIQLETLKQQHDLEMDQRKRGHLRRQAIQDAYANGLSQVIADHLSNGYTLQELWDQYPELRPLLQSSIETQREGHAEPQRLLPQVSGTQGTPQAPGVLRALPPPLGSSSQTGEQSRMRVRARRQINEQGESEVIEVQAVPAPDGNVVYEPVIKIKQRRPAEGNVPKPAPPLAPAVDPFASTIAVPPVSNESIVQVPSPLITGTTFHNDRLGVTLATVTEEERRALQLDEQIVFSVQSVDAGSPAQRASIIRSDFLVEINHQPITDIQSLLSRLEECTDDTMIAIRVLRQGQLLNLPEIPVKKEEQT